MVHDFISMKKSMIMIFMVYFKQKCLFESSIIWAKTLDLIKCVA